MRTIEKTALATGAGITASALLGAALITGCSEPTTKDRFAASLRTDTDRTLAGQSSLTPYRTVKTTDQTVAYAAIRKALSNMEGRFLDNDSPQNSIAERNATILCWTAGQAGLLTPEDSQIISDSLRIGDQLIEMGVYIDNPYIYNQNYAYIDAAERCGEELDIALAQGDTIALPIELAQTS